MSDEIEKVREEFTLAIKSIASFICTMEYNMFLSSRKGEQIDRYIKVWSGKFDTTIEQIKVAPTAKKALDICYEFDGELVIYIKATKVDTADKAMEIAHSFIKKYVPVALPLKAERKGDEWLVDIDVGALAVKIAKVKVDARTGDILSYEIPEKGIKKAK